MAMTGRFTAPAMPETWASRTLGEVTQIAIRRKLRETFGAL
jgi:hypothetical protein